MRLKSVSFSSFFAYLRKRKETVLVILILLASLIFIFFGMRSDTETAEESDALEEKVEGMCKSIEGVGKCKVLVYYKEQSSRYETQKVESVVVVCEGGDSVEVKKCLTELLSSFFGIGSNRVRIEKMQK